MNPMCLFRMSNLAKFCSRKQFARWCGSPDVGRVWRGGGGVVFRPHVSALSCPTFRLNFFLSAPIKYGKFPRLSPRLVRTKRLPSPTRPVVPSVQPETLYSATTSVERWRLIGWLEECKVQLERLRRVSLVQGK